jgi:hypothetical protein
VSDYDNRRDTDRNTPDERSPSVRTRAGDDTREAEDFMRQRRAYRRMTIVYATFCAGLLGLLINGAFYNQTAGNNQDNCILTQSGFTQDYLGAQRVIDESDDPAAVERQIIARNEFAKLIPYSKQTPHGSGETCKQQFPKKSYIIF